MRTSADFFQVRVHSVPPDLPLEYELYLFINNDYVLFRKLGDRITTPRMKALLNHKLKLFFIPLDQKELYRASLRQYIQRDDLSIELRGKCIKESAFNHIDDLFSRPSVGELIKESTELVQNLVSFITDDLEGAANLMKLSSHDYYTYNHSVNVAVYTVAIAKRVLGNNKELLIQAGLGGLLHDLGKRAIHKDVINKPGKLTPSEWTEMKKHPSYGYTLLEKLPVVTQETKRIVLEHHENVDGSGYPRSLMDNQISKLSKIATIADVFDALTTTRSYKEAASPKEALQIMASMAPGKFDPTLFTFFDNTAGKKPEVTLDKNCDPCTQGLPVKKAG